MGADCHGSRFSFLYVRCGFVVRQRLYASSGIPSSEPSSRKRRSDCRRTLHDGRESSAVGPHCDPRSKARLCRDRPRVDSLSTAYMQCRITSRTAWRIRSGGGGGSSSPVRIRASSFPMRTAAPPRAGKCPEPGGRIDRRAVRSSVAFPSGPLAAASSQLLPHHRHERALDQFVHEFRRSVVRAAWSLRLAPRYQGRTRASPTDICRDEIPCRLSYTELSSSTSRQRQCLSARRRKPSSSNNEREAQIAGSRVSFLLR